MVPGWPTKGNKVTDCFVVVVVVRADLADLLACKKETKLFTFLLHPLWIGVIPHTRTQMKLCLVEQQILAATKNVVADVNTLHCTSERANISFQFVNTRAMVRSHWPLLSPLSLPSLHFLWEMFLVFFCFENCFFQIISVLCVCELLFGSLDRKGKVNSG